MAVKNKKLKCFYVETTKAKPLQILARRYIHSQASGGFWCSVRDLSQKERLANEAVGHETVVTFIVGFNLKILQMWEKLTLVDEQGRTYTIKEKPDEFDYTKQDIKIRAYEFKDERTYQGGDTYET